MIRRGFTVVELVIIITILGILLTLAVVSVSATQVNARDSERKADVEAIAMQLEAFYTNADSGISLSGNAYPGMSRLSNAEIYTVLPDIDKKSTHAPGVDVSAPVSIVSATNAVETAGGVLPQPTTTTYVYQALKRDGTLCTTPSLAEYNVGECRKFNLYYRQESNNSVQVIRSKHQ